jgi:hypothetical protein
MATIAKDCRPQDSTGADGAGNVETAEQEQTENGSHDNQTSDPGGGVATDSESLLGIHHGQAPPANTLSFKMTSFVRTYRTPLAWKFPEISNREDGRVYNH